MPTSTHSVAGAGRGRRIVVHGGLGDPQTSAVALHAPALRQFGAELIAVDPQATLSTRRRLVADRTGLDFAACLTPEEYLSWQGRNPPPDAALILTPVVHHVPLMRQYVGRAPRLLVVEKPATGIDDVDGLEQVQADLGPNRCYFVDTAMVAPALHLGIDSGIVQQIGPVRRIVAVGLDNPWTPAPGLEEFSLAAKQHAINTRGLLVPSRSGGAGTGLDMGIHAVTGLSVLLEHLGLAIEDLRARAVRLALADLPGWRREPGGETHLLVEARVGGIDVVVEAGKGGGIWDRRLEVTGDRGACAMGFGTLAHHGWLWRSDARGESLWRLPTPDTGYGRHLSDVAALLGCDPGRPIVTPQASARHMIGALRVLGTWYRSSGASPEEREQRIIRERGHPNPLLTREDLQRREHLDELMQVHLRI